MTDTVKAPDQPTLDIANPYWDAVVQCPPDDIYAKYERRWSPASFPRLTDLRGGREAVADWYEKYGRTRLVQQYAWAIPSPSVLLWMVEALDGRPVVEMGAGTGYWTWLLEQLGVDVVAYDIHPPLQGENGYHCKDGAPGSQYAEIRIGGPEVLTNLGDRVLFLSWPPYNRPMAGEALAAYPGDMLIEIGEGDGGCTGDDAFYALLHDEWNAVDRGPLVQWSGMHDNITLWRRQ